MVTCGPCVDPSVDRQTDMTEHFPLHTPLRGRGVWGGEIESYSNNFGTVMKKQYITYLWTYYRGDNETAPVLEATTVSTEMQILPPKLKELNIANSA